MLFVSPEKLFADSFEQLCQTLPPINLACIDEVHCISRFRQRLDMGAGMAPHRRPLGHAPHTIRKLSSRRSKGAQAGRSAHAC